MRDKNARILNKPYTNTPKIIPVNPKDTIITHKSKPIIYEKKNSTTTLTIPQNIFLLKKTINNINVKYQIEYEKNNEKIPLSRFKKSISIVHSILS